MSKQNIINPKGAFGYSSTAAGSRRGVDVEVFRNMSTVNTVAVGQAVVASTLVGEGNEILPGTTVIGTQRAIGIAVESATTNSNTTNQSTASPAGSFFRAVTRGPVQAFVTSAVEKGDLLTVGNSTVAPIAGGRLEPITSAVNGANGRTWLVGYALTSGTSGTTTPNGRVNVQPGWIPTHTS